jgi:hypothetical protein
LRTRCRAVDADRVCDRLASARALQTVYLTAPIGAACWALSASLHRRRLRSGDAIRRAYSSSSWLHAHYVATCDTCDTCDAAISAADGGNCRRRRARTRAHEVG